MRAPSRGAKLGGMRLDTQRTKDRCARARRHARALSKARAKAERDQATVTQDAPIQLPDVQLPGGLGAADPLPPPPAAPQSPADSPVNPPTQAPAADASDDASAAQQQPAQGGGSDQTSTTQSDPKQGLFDYLLGN